MVFFTYYTGKLQNKRFKNNIFTLSNIGTHHIVPYP